MPNPLSSKSRTSCTSTSTIIYMPWHESVTFHIIGGLCSKRYSQPARGWWCTVCLCIIWFIRLDTFIESPVHFHLCLVFPLICLYNSVRRCSHVRTKGLKVTRLIR
jgi:hypothetical protein